jgi:hypothetical protein
MYVVVHEMVHVLEPTHNARFVALVDRLMPQWRICRDQLNQLRAMRSGLTDSQCLPRIICLWVANRRCLRESGFNDLYS